MDVVGILSTVAIFLFITGALLLIVSYDLRKRYVGSTRQILEVVICPIPEQDLEKSPAPDLNSIDILPHRRPVVARQGIELVITKG